VCACVGDACIGRVQGVRREGRRGPRHGVTPSTKYIIFAYPLTLPVVTASHEKGAGRVPGAPGEGAMPVIITPQSTLGFRVRVEDIAAAGEGRRIGVLSSGA